jgi:hypothetical protein
LAVLVPAAVLFAQVWRWTGETRDDIGTERGAVTYLVALSQLTVALGDAQSDAVAGRSGSRDGLARGIDAVNGVETRFGAGLRTSARWTNVRETIESLPTSGGMQAFTAFSEVSDQLRALYNLVWVNGLLAREPQTDAYFLADAGAEEMPQTLIAVGRVAELSMQLGTRPASELPAALAALAAAQAALVEAGGDLTDDLQSAVDGNAQGNLSASLLSRLDRFRRAVDSVATAALPTGQNRPTVDVERVSKARTDVQAAGTDLHTAILRELDALVAARGDGLDTQRQIAIAAIALAAILALAPVFAALLRRRRPWGRPDASSPVLVQSVPSEMGPRGEMIGELSLSRREHSGAR